MSGMDYPFPTWQRQIGTSKWRLDMQGGPADNVKIDLTHGGCVIFGANRLMNPDVNSGTSLGYVTISIFPTAGDLAILTHSEAKALRRALKAFSG